MVACLPIVEHSRIFFISFSGMENLEAEVVVDWEYQDGCQTNFSRHQRDVWLSRFYEPLLMLDSRCEGRICRCARDGDGRFCDTKDFGTYLVLDFYTGKTAMTGKHNDESLRFAIVQRSLGRKSSYTLTY